MSVAAGDNAGLNPHVTVINQVVGWQPLFSPNTAPLSSHQSNTDLLIIFIHQNGKEHIKERKMR